VKKKLLAEALGTFGIVFAPCALAGAGESGLLLAALVSGLSVTAMIHALGHISGDFNPAVTLALASVRKRERREIVPYVLAQALGALLAALVCRALFGPGSWGTHRFTGSPLRALGLEATITFFLMLTVLGSATDERSPRGFAGLAVGFWVVVGVLLAGPVTGGSMNPARSLGPALVSGGTALAAWWVYLLGPTLGALGATALYQKLRP
jgi:MIP family channel proteins